MKGVGWEDRIENCLRGHCRGGGGFRPGTHFVIVSLLDMTIDQGIGGIHSTNVLKKCLFHQKLHSSQSVCSARKTIKSLR